MKLDIIAGSKNDEFYTPEYAITPILKVCQGLFKGMVSIRYRGKLICEKVERKRLFGYFNAYYIRRRFFQTRTADGVRLYHIESSLFDKRRRSRKIVLI